MRKTLAFNAVIIACLSLPSIAQSMSEKAALFTWSIHTPEIVVARRSVSTYPVAVFTPGKDIVVRRVEALSNRGPARGFAPNGEPIACPVQYSLELTNGSVTQSVPISNVFLNSNTSQTYTDNGPLSLPFERENRITLSIVPPKPQFPAVSCGVEGLNITIQYEMAGTASQKP